MPSMNDVIFELKNGHIGAAISQMLHLTGMTYQQSQMAIEALRPYLDPSYSKTAKASPEAPESIPQRISDIMHGDPEGTDRKATSEFSPEDFKDFPEPPVTIQKPIPSDDARDALKRMAMTAEPTEAKPQIDAWMVTGSQLNGDDWCNRYTSENRAIAQAKNLCSQGFTQVRISRVIAEAKATTTWSIDL